MALLIDLKQAAVELGIAPSTLKSPAAREKLGLDVAVVKLGRRVLVNAEVLREALREMAGHGVPVRQPTTRRAVI